MIANKIYKGVLVKDPTKNSQSNKAKSQSSIKLPRSTDYNLVVLEPIKASLVDLDNSKSKNEFVNSDEKLAPKKLDIGRCFHVSEVHQHLKGVRIMILHGQSLMLLTVYK